MNQDEQIAKQIDERIRALVSDNVEFSTRRASIITLAAALIQERAAVGAAAAFRAAEVCCDEYLKCSHEVLSREFVQRGQSGEAADALFVELMGGENARIAAKKIADGALQLRDELAAAQQRQGTDAALGIERSGRSA